MTTQHHLIYRMQEQYSFIRDVLPLLGEIEHSSNDELMRALLHQERQGLRNEMDTLERGLSLLGARYKMELSPIAPAVKEAYERFKHRMNPSAEQRDIQAVMEIAKLSLMSVAEYQEDAELARSIGEQDLAILLEENMHRENESLDGMRKFISHLIAQIGKSETKAA